jgi:hypothetical protein
MNNLGNGECSKDEGREIRRLAKWARAYAQRLGPINRIGKTAAEFRNSEEEE